MRRIGVFAILASIISFGMSACDSRGTWEAIQEADVAIEGGKHRQITVSDQSQRSITEVFRIKNIGDQPLHLSPNIQTSCGCTEALLAKETLKPGESTSVEATVSLKSGTTYVDILVPIEGSSNLAIDLSLVVDCPMRWQVSPDTLLVRSSSEASKVTNAKWYINGQKAPAPEDITIDTQIEGFSFRVVEIQERAQSLIIHGQFTQAIDAPVSRTGEIRISVKNTDFKWSGKILID